MNAEKKRLEENRLNKKHWLRWGPYLSERQWGTVREDYSANGDAWEYFPFEHSHCRAYRWGEDGIAGLSDSDQVLCLGVALWNERDPVLKERLYGLTNSQGNHGEDVKELYYYLDATPTHSYLKYLYKYPQSEFPYQQLLNANRVRGLESPEYEIIETGVFDENRYFDVFVEYAKSTPDDVNVRITVHNRGPDPAPLHVLPQLWYRNTWSWKLESDKPTMMLAADGAITTTHRKLGEQFLYFDGAPQVLFCENETNSELLYGLKGEEAKFPKDAINNFVVHGRPDAVNPSQAGTKAAAHFVLTIGPGESQVVRARLTNKGLRRPFSNFDATVDARRNDGDLFYEEIQKDISDPNLRQIQRQALAGMIWNKQYYHYDVSQWIRGDSGQPSPPWERRHGRNNEWPHLNNADILSMPDKWEYPWFAAWDSAFHCIPLAMVDPEFAKQQILLLTREWYMHPNGQLPAYEWNFSDVNPPVHAWATWRVFQIDRKCRKKGDLVFLEKVFHKLMLNFTWWVNRKDAQGRNIFQGGFLGLDNIGVFDRSKPLPNGGTINQSDATAWMSMYCLNLMRIALELALHNPVYEDVALKFFEHFLYIAQAMTNIGGNGIGVGLWDDEDEFYYDELILPDGSMQKLRVRSMVGLIPLFAVETLEPELLERLPNFHARLKWFLNYRPDLAGLVSRWHEAGRGDRRLLSLLRGSRMKRLLRRMLDETEFLSEYGVRALSKKHLDQPYTFSAGGDTLTVKYIPADSDSRLFGGNSNWRGPIWFPVNYLIIESLQKFHHYYGSDFKIECPTGSGKYLTIEAVANELSDRLVKLFKKDSNGMRPVYATSPKLQNDPHFRDYIHFFEYFHGDTGRGLGASHQTGWTGLVAKLIQPRKQEFEDDGLAFEEEIVEGTATPDE